MSHRTPFSTVETSTKLDPEELAHRQALRKKAKAGDEMSLWVLRRIYHLTKWWNKEDGTIVGE